MVESRELPQKMYRYGMTKDMKSQGKLYDKGEVTHQSIGQEGHKRTLAERHDRAILFSEIIKKKREMDQAKDEKDTEKVNRLKDEIKDVLREGKTLDEYYAIHSKPKLVSVDMGELGIQKAEVVDYVTENTDLSKDPIIVLMGISNDKDGIGVFGLRLAKETGRRVIMISHPDSWYGEVTEKFAKAVKESKNFGPHTAFFKAVINQMIGKEGHFDICGVSAGSIMASEIVKDKDFTDRIGKKNFIVPPGITPLTIKNFLPRILMQKREMREEKRTGDLLKLMISNIEEVKKGKDQVKARKKTFWAMFWQLAKNYPWWVGLNEGNVVIGDRDAVTYGFKNIDKVEKENPNLKVHMIKGSHQIAAIKWEEVIGKMDL